MAYTKKITSVYIDGACKGNPGPGGWAAVINFEDGSQKLESGFEKATTNNRMELMAAIKALECCSNNTDSIDVYTDSMYVKNGITSWINSWKANNWQKSDKKPVKNVDLWQELAGLINAQPINWHWVKAHNGDQFNEQADSLARNEIAVKAIAMSMLSK